MSSPRSSRPPAQASWLVPALAAGGVALLGWFAYTQFDDAAVPQPGAASAVTSPTLRDESRSAPPMPYRFAGTRVQDGATQYLLEEGERVFPATAGMIVDGSYRVDTVSAAGIALVHLPTGVRQSVPMTQAAWPPPTAENAGVPAAPAAQSPLPPAVMRTTSPGLQELAR